MSGPVVFRTTFTRVARAAVIAFAGIAAVVLARLAPGATPAPPERWTADSFAAPIARSTNNVRGVLVTIGVLGLLFAAYTFMTTVNVDHLSGLLIWLGAAVVLHDGILSPVVFGANWMLRHRAGRRIPGAVLAIVQITVIVGVIFTFMVVPEIRAKQLGPNNPTVLPFDYALRLGLLWLVLIVLATAASALILRRRASPASGRNSGDPELRRPNSGVSS